MVTNKRSNSSIVASGVYTWVRLKAINETKQLSSVSYKDDSDQLAH
jgi:hypothetical protein